MQLNSTQGDLEHTINFNEGCTYDLWHHQRWKKRQECRQRKIMWPWYSQRMMIPAAWKSSMTAESRSILFQISVWTRPKWKRASRRPQSSPKRWDIIHSDISPFCWPPQSGKVSSCPDRLLIFHALINARLWRCMIPIRVTPIDGCSDVYSHAHGAGARVALCAVNFDASLHFHLSVWGTLATS